MILSVNQIFQHQFTIDSLICESFIEIFKDKNALHTNEEFAKEKGFAGKVMHGNILNGFISYFVGELLPSEEVMILSQTINFKNPVYLNDILDFEAKVIEQSEAVKVDVIKFKFVNSSLKVVASGKIQIKELK